MSAGESAPNRGDGSAPNGGATSASADGTSPLLIERLPDRTVIRLNRPEVRNAIDESMVEALHSVCAELEAEPKIAILTGTSGVFAAGADIGQLRDRRRDDALAGINSKIFTRIQQLPMPVIALVEGFALGGGAELAFAADFRIGTPSTRIGNPEAGLGILAAAGAAWRLRELVGEPRAKEILLAGRTLQADEAKAIGLLNDVVDPEDLEAAGQALAERIASFAPLAVRLSKSAFHAPREAHPLIDNVAQAVLFESQEKFARMDAFLSKREAKKAKKAAEAADTGGRDHRPGDERRQVMSETTPDTPDLPRGCPRPSASTAADGWGRASLTPSPPPVPASSSSKAPMTPWPPPADASTPRSRNRSPRASTCPAPSRSSGIPPCSIRPSSSSRPFPRTSDSNRRSSPASRNTLRPRASARTPRRCRSTNSPPHCRDRRR
jgi:enoyl-CoA hydratase